jgi:hypothetical protein
VASSQWEQAWKVKERHRENESHCMDKDIYAARSWPYDDSLLGYT